MDLFGVFGDVLIRDLISIVSDYATFKGITVQTLKGYLINVSCMVVLPDGRLATGSWDTTIRVWDLTTATSQVLRGHTKTIKCLVILPDGRLASGSWDKTIQLWDLVTGTSQMLEERTRIINCLAVLPDCRLAAGSYDGMIRLWDPTHMIKSRS